MSLYDQTIPQFKNTLTQLDKWLDAAVAYAKAKSFEPAVLLNSRLAPDQYPLVRQIQAVCDAAKFTAARVTGKEPPKHPDTEQTVEELRTRIRAVQEYLGSYKPEDFAGAETRQVKLPWLEGKYVLGVDYVNQLQLPNFYFHATLAYEILRHNGVPLGKTDYIGHVNLH
ncbi:MAG TPA: DUF1993 domain-containing protein [Polyangiaceae bacterium]|nr:DUF1993 domain-containing protein [Polyangiaceae bacterium]